MGNAWSRTPKKIRQDIAKLMRELNKHAKALESAKFRVNDIAEQNDKLSDQLHELREELLRSEFNDFYFPASALTDFVHLVIKPVGDPVIEQEISNRIEETLELLRSRAIHITALSGEIQNPDHEYEVVVQEGEFGELVCELYDPELHPKARVYRMRLVPIDFGEQDETD